MSLPIPVTLCLFRHGRTTWNVLGKYQGQTDTELDDLGRAQARAVGMRCREMNPVALYTSDLQRCRDVAEQVQTLTGIEVVADVRLRETDFGAWSGHTRAEIADLFAEEYKAWRAGDQDVRPGGTGESQKMLRTRVTGFVDSIRERHESGLVVAVSHAAWIRNMARWVLGTDGSPNLGTPSQGSLTVITLGNEHHTLETYNDRGHLLSMSPADQETHTPAVY